MSMWIESKKKRPPKDRCFLGYGLPSSLRGVVFQSPGVHCCYWDEMDSAYCVKAATWEGPFIKPTHWQEEPSPPNLENIS